MRLQQLARLLLLPIFTVTLISCGGSSVNPLGGSSSIDTHGNEVINGIVVPPDPGAAKDATLAGVDSDHNGIRDELDRFIATKYGNNPGALEAIRMVYGVNQETILSNPTTQDQALAVAYRSMDVGGCTGRKLEKESLVAGNIFNEAMIRSFNTRERIDARKKVFELAGMIVRSSKEVRKMTCPFETW